MIGSSNTDMVVKTSNFPKPGETVLGGEFLMNPGGKGANQAVAAARLGANVSFVGRVGNDLFGKEAVAHLQEEGIDVTHIEYDAKLSSGIALITVDQKAENTIVVASGANNALHVDDYSKLDALIDADAIVLMQLEIPLETVRQMAQYAKSRGALVVLNPAPAAELAADILQFVDIITPNEHEISTLTQTEVTDAETAGKAASLLAAKGPAIVLVTMGSKGVLLFQENNQHAFAAEKIVAVDTTAAGDVFNGAFVAFLSKGYSLHQAIALANHAAGISVTRNGAQSSAPFLHELSIDF